MNNAIPFQTGYANDTIEKTDMQLKDDVIAELREEAERAAWAAPGVFSVNNQLTVKWFEFSQ